MSERRAGMDRRGADFLTALVTDESGRHVITELSVSTVPSDFENIPGNYGRLSLAMPDDIAIIKQIQLGESELSDAEERVRFELVQSLLEDEHKFYFGVIPTGLNGYYLGLIMRRDRVELGRELYGCRPQTDSEVPFQIRAVANGRGYLAFCRRTAGDLVALVDITVGQASICIVYRDAIVDISSLALVPADLANSERAARFAVDLKTVLNFRLAGLLDKGISLPLSGLLLWGDEVDNSFRVEVGRQFSVKIGEPHINKAFLAETVESDGPDGDCTNKYLVALGLTVK